MPNANRFRVRERSFVRRSAAHFGAALAASLALAAGGCGGEKEGAGKGGAGGPAGPAVEVTVQPVSVRPVQRSVEVTGTLFGEEDVTLSNKVPGRVIAVYKDIGDRAAPGEALAQLLPNDYQRTLAQRQRAVEETLAKLGLQPGDLPPADFDVESLPAVRQAKFQAANTRAKFERGRKLHEQKPPLLSEQDFADLQTAYEVARSAYEAERLTARSLVGEARTRQAEVAIAEQAVKDTTIRAPRPLTVGPDGMARGEAGGDEVPSPAPAGGGAAPAPSGGPPQGGPANGEGPGGDGEKQSPVGQGAERQTLDGENPDEQGPEGRGAAAPAGPAAVVPPAGGGDDNDQTKPFVVSARLVSVGELLSPITPMFRVVDDDPLKLRAAVPERYGPDIKVGQKVEVTVESFGGRKFFGEVTRVNPQIEAGSRTFQIEAHVPNADHALKPGAFTRARVLTGMQPGAVFVPAESVVSFAGVTKVYTVKDGKAAESPVTLGQREAGWVEVKKFDATAEVVVGNAGKLAAGVPVTVAETLPPARVPGVTTPAGPTSQPTGPAAAEAAVR